MVTENPPECRALIVEDEYAFQKSLEIALKQIPNPWKMEIFSRGQDAIDFISNLSGHLDVALVDLGLPDTSGNAVIEKIRAYFPKTPILVVTTHMSRTSLISALRAGANGYVLKDATRAELTINIEHILGGRTPISPALTADIIMTLLRSSSRNMTPMKSFRKERSNC